MTVRPINGTLRGRRLIDGRRNPSEIREMERVSCAQTFRATLFHVLRAALSDVSRRKHPVNRADDATGRGSLEHHSCPAERRDREPAASQPRNGLKRSIRRVASLWAFCFSGTGSISRVHCRRDGYHRLGVGVHQHRAAAVGGHAGALPCCAVTRKFHGLARRCTIAVRLRGACPPKRRPPTRGHLMGNNGRVCL